MHFVLSDTDNVEDILKELDDSLFIKNNHHEKDIELLNIPIIYSNTQDYYISKMYSTMVEIFNDMNAFSKKCDSLIICNKLLKQHISNLESRPSYNFPTSNILNNLSSDDDNIFVE